MVLLAPIGFVWYISAKVDSLSPTTAATLFSVYAGLNGITFAFVLLAYTGASIASAFLTTSAMFGALALYGTITKRSLAGVGQFAFMGLIGVVIASIVGIFWQNDMFQFILSVCGVVVFTGADRLGCPAAQGDGPGLAGWQARLLRDRRGAGPVPRLHQPVPVHPAAFRAAAVDEG